MDPRFVSDDLQQLGMTTEDAPALLLVPGAVVAWADNRADLKELETIAASHAESQCGENVLCVSEKAREFIYYHFVYQRPNADLLARVLSIIHQLVESCPTENERNHIRTFIAGVCVDVAQSSGDGLLGFLNRVDTREKQAIAEMTAEIDLHKSPEAREKLRHIGV